MNYSVLSHSAFLNPMLPNLFIRPIFVEYLICDKHGESRGRGQGPQRNVSTLMRLTFDTNEVRKKADCRNEKGMSGRG